MKLVVTDTKEKADLLTHKLGSEYTVLILSGSVKTLPKKEMGISIKGDKVGISIQDDPRSVDSIQQIKSYLNVADTVYLAMEPDREGAFKAYYLSNTLSKEGKTKNIILHELTKEAIHEAMKNPIPLNSQSVSAHLTRRIFDRIAGHTIGADLMKQFGRNVPASISQAMSVKTVMNREKEINRFQQMSYCEINAVVDGLGFVLQTGEGKKHPTYLQQSTADTLMGILEVKPELDIKTVEICEYCDKAPEAFSTMTMLQAAHKVLGYSVEDTMNFAQNLYELGYITFYKTKGTSVSQRGVEMAHEYIRGKYGPEYIGKIKECVYPTECIRPTKITSGAELPPQEKQLLQMICKRFIASQMADCRYSCRVIKAMNPSLDYAAKKNNKYSALFFSCTQKKMIYDGYRKVLQPEDVEYDMIISDSFVEGAFHEGSQLKADFSVMQKQTISPQRFTEGSFVKELEKQGIVAPETVVSMVKSLKARNFVNQNSPTLEPTELCGNVYDYLQEHYPSIINEEYAAKIEKRLDLIQEEEKWKPAVFAFYEEMQKKD